jgi:hypothetical protein
MPFSEQIQHNSSEAEQLAQATVRIGAKSLFI